ncbi:hypothetical protein ABK040_006689 [Willaertia magna]
MKGYTALILAVIIASFMSFVSPSIFEDYYHGSSSTHVPYIKWMNYWNTTLTGGYNTMYLYSSCVTPILKRVQSDEILTGVYTSFSSSLVGISGIYDIYSNRWDIYIKPDSTEMNFGGLFMKMVYVDDNSNIGFERMEWFRRIYVEDTKIKPIIKQLKQVELNNEEVIVMIVTTDTNAVDNIIYLESGIGISASPKIFTLPLSTENKKSYLVVNYNSKGEILSNYTFVNVNGELEPFTLITDNTNSQWNVYASVNNDLTYLRCNVSFCALHPIHISLDSDEVLESITNVKARFIGEFAYFVGRITFSIYTVNTFESVFSCKLNLKTEETIWLKFSNSYEVNKVKIIDLSIVDNNLTLAIVGDLLLWDDKLLEVYETNCFSIIDLDSNTGTLTEAACVNLIPDSSLRILTNDFTGSMLFIIGDQHILYNSRYKEIGRFRTKFIGDIILFGKDHIVYFGTIPYNSVTFRDRVLRRGCLHLMQIEFKKDTLLTSMTITHPSFFIKGNPMDDIQVVIDDQGRLESNLFLFEISSSKFLSSYIKFTSNNITILMDGMKLDLEGDISLWKLTNTMVVDGFKQLWQSEPISWVKTVYLISNTKIMKRNDSDVGIVGRSDIYVGYPISSIHSILQSSLYYKSSCDITGQYRPCLLEEGNCYIQLLSNEPRPCEYSMYLDSGKSQLVLLDKSTFQFFSGGNWTTLISNAIPWSNSFEHSIFTPFFKLTALMGYNNIYCVVDGVKRAYINLYIGGSSIRGVDCGTIPSPNKMEDSYSMVQIMIDVNSTYSATLNYNNLYLYFLDNNHSIWNNVKFVTTSVDYIEQALLSFRKLFTFDNIKNSLKLKYLYNNDQIDYFPIDYINCFTVECDIRAKVTLSDALTGTSVTKSVVFQNDFGEIPITDNYNMYIFKKVPFYLPFEDEQDNVIIRVSEFEKTVSFSFDDTNLPPFFTENLYCNISDGNSFLIFKMYFDQSLDVYNCTIDKRKFGQKMYERKLNIVYNTKEMFAVESLDSFSSNNITVNTLAQGEVLNDADWIFPEEKKNVSLIVQFIYNPFLFDYPSEVAKIHCSFIYDQSEVSNNNIEVTKYSGLDWTYVINCGHPRLANENTNELQVQLKYSKTIDMITTKRLRLKNKRVVCDDISTTSCSCKDGYLGYYCETPICFGKVEGACSSNGYCTDHNECICKDNHYGEECENVIDCHLSDSWNSVICEFLNETTLPIENRYFINERDVMDYKIYDNNITAFLTYTSDVGNNKDHLIISFERDILCTVRSITPEPFPIPALSFPSSIGSSSSLLVVASFTLSPDSRKLDITWLLKSVSCYDSQSNLMALDIKNINSLREYLSLQRYPVLSVPPSLLNNLTNSDERYCIFEFKMVVENIFGNTASKVANITRYTQIDLPTFFPIRNQFLCERGYECIIEIQRDIPMSLTEPLFTTWSYEGKITPSVKPSFLVIPPFYLLPGTKKEFSSTLIVPKLGMIPAQVEAIILPKEMVVKIIGGDKSYTRYQPVILNAQTNIQEIVDKENEIIQLAYKWSCVKGCSTAILNTLSNARDSLVKILDVNPGQKIVIKLEVANVCSKGNPGCYYLSGYAETTVYVSYCPHDISLASATLPPVLTNYEYYIRFALIGTIEENYYSEWKLYTPDHEQLLANITYFSKSSTLPFDVSKYYYHYLPHVVLRYSPRFLQENLCNDLYLDVKFRIADKPSYGHCMVVPTTGMALVDTFSIECIQHDPSSWFLFYYKNSELNTTFDITSVSYGIPFQRTPLPPNSKLYARIYNRDSAFNEIELPVNVIPFSKGLTEFEEMFFSNLAFISTNRKSENMRRATATIHVLTENVISMRNQLGESLFNNYIGKIVDELHSITVNLPQDAVFPYFQRLSSTYSLIFKTENLNSIIKTKIIDIIEDIFIISKGLARFTNTDYLILYQLGFANQDMIVESLFKIIGLYRFNFDTTTVVHLNMVLEELVDNALRLAASPSPQFYKDLDGIILHKKLFFATVGNNSISTFKFGETTANVHLVVPTSRLLSANAISVSFYNRKSFIGSSIMPNFTDSYDVVSDVMLIKSEAYVYTMDSEWILTNIDLDKETKVNYVLEFQSIREQAFCFSINGDFELKSITTFYNSNTKTVTCYLDGVLRNDMFFGLLRPKIETDKNLVVYILVPIAAVFLVVIILVTIVTIVYLFFRKIRSIVRGEVNNMNMNIQLTESLTRSFNQNNNIDVTEEFSERYEKISRIGQGGEATVYLCKPVNSDEINQYAVKLITLDDQKNINEAIQEGLKLAQATHKHIVPIIEMFVAVDFGEKKLCIVMPYLRLGHLRKVVVTNGPLSLKLIVSILKQMVEVLILLEEKSIIHRDIKMENILVKEFDKNRETIHLLLSDFGIAKSKRVAQTVAGTKVFFSPEVVLNSRIDNFYYTNKVDIWALGCILYQLLSNDFETALYAIWLEKTEAAAVKEFLLTNIKKYQPKLAENTMLIDLLCGMLEKEPEKRLSPTECLKLVKLIR